MTNSEVSVRPSSQLDVQTKGFCQSRKGPYISSFISVHERPYALLNCKQKQKQKIPHK
jgi:hypothetical protein